jgi:diguanylate cyclase (GGDEF)-like protein
LRRYGRQIRQYFATGRDPYAGGDLINARRLGATLWVVTLTLTAALSIFSPPTAELGETGWLVAAAFAGGATIALVALWRRQLLASWRILLIASTLPVAWIAVMQWLAGGLEPSYDGLLLLPVVYVAAVHPPSRIAAFLALVLIVRAAPLAYDHWDADAAGHALAEGVIWSTLAFVINALMTGVRAQRLTHARDQAAARKEARIDSLTGLQNRRAFEEMLEVEVERAAGFDLPLSVAMIDIEEFKEINDLWGYREGDQALRSLAETLRSSVRPPDLCFRWGGDEFAVIMEAHADGAESLGRRIAAKVDRSCRRPDDERLRIRFAVAELRVGMDANELVEMAGLALLAAKSDATLR